ncbi:MAG: hypothetical protein J1E34_07815 [Oscillospiraceae bacterium]|nr:hypothetical protein [Oscillospiraceae bacterium]
METLKNTALMLLFAAVMGLIYYFLLPSGKISQTAKSVLSVFMLLVVMQPLFSFMNMEMPDIDLYAYGDFAELDDNFISAAKNAVISQIDGVIKKYTETPYNIEVPVNISENRSIDIEQVRIVFNKGFIPEEEMKEELFFALGAEPLISVREDE